MDTKHPEALPDLIDRMRSLPGCHTPDGWPAVRTGEITALIAELDRQHAENETLRAGYDAARLEIESLKTDHLQALTAYQTAVDNLTAQMEAVGAGGMEPLRKRCLHQISEPQAQPAAQTQPVGAECPSCGAASEVAGFVCVDCYYAEQKTGELSTDYVQGFAHGQATLAPPQPAAPAQAGEYPPLGKGSLWRDAEGIRGYGADPGPGPWHTTEDVHKAIDADRAASSVYSRSMDLVRAFWQQHTESDALSMTMAELHDDVELVIRAARGAAQAAPVDAAVQQDAERYHGLRARACMGYPSGEGSDSKDAYLVITGYGYDDNASVVDAAVDAARAAQGGA